MLKLYYSPGACAMASHIALEEAGADYVLVKVDLKAGEQKTPAYLAVNPAGSTPALVTESGVLTENLAIMAYVAHLHPQPGLTDRDAPYDYHRMLAFNAFLGSSLHPAIGKVLFSRPPLEGEAKTAALELALSKYDLVEQHLFTGPWVLGEIYSAADGYLSVFTRWARAAYLLDPARYPKLNAHLDAVQARPAVQRVLMQEGLQPV